MKLRNVFYAIVVAFLGAILLAIFVGGPVLERLEGMLP
jgi:hypothetical protein